MLRLSLRIWVSISMANYTVADILRTLLVDLGVGTMPEDEDPWPIFVAQEPTLPDNTITIFDTEGMFRGRIQVTGKMDEKPGIQIRIRGDGYSQQSKALQVLNALDTLIRLNEVVLGSDLYTVIAVTRTTGVLHIGKEPQADRDIWVINALVSFREE